MLSCDYPARILSKRAKAPVGGCLRHSRRDASSVCMPSHCPCTQTLALHHAGNAPVRLPQAQLARHAVRARQACDKGGVVQLAAELGVDEAVEVRVQVQVAP